MATSARGWNVDVGLLLIRLILAVVFLYHGSQKLFGAFGGPGLEKFAEMLAGMNMPAPRAGAYAAALAEFLGGLALLTGVGQRVIGAALAFTMLVASFKVHGSAFGAQHNGMEYPLTLGIVVLGLVFTGPGRLSLWPSPKVQNSELKVQSEEGAGE